MKFHYVAFRQTSDDGEHDVLVHRPVVPIILRGPRGVIRRFGLVDTGADYSLMPTWVAEAIGITLDAHKLTPLTGVGGMAIEGCFGEIELELRRSQESLRWMGAAYFADQDYVLLGSQGFLEYFVAEFDWEERVFELSPNRRFTSTLCY